MSNRIDMIREKLTAAFEPVQLDIIDESHKHAGHPGARSGGGHFVVTIISTAFEGKNMLARHRMIYDALGDMMTSEIHALSLKAYTPDEMNA
jgi:BolA family transcriptional regulator, general stress-responsive regulator